MRLRAWCRGQHGVCREIQVDVLATDEREVPNDGRTNEERYESRIFNSGGLFIHCDADKLLVTPVEQQIIDFHSDDIFVDEAVFRQYPSHLHIDLMPRAQGKGLGTKMIKVTFLYTVITVLSSSYQAYWTAFAEGTEKARFSRSSFGDVAIQRESVHLLSKIGVC